ncbi:MAG: DegT/DnrJ/EryC1/StrS family aminotransferase [Myxococcota bacterium]
MAVPFVDLKAIHEPIRDRMLHAIEQVVRTDRYVLGPEVAAFEDEAAAFLGVEHAVGVSSGTDALLVALMALDVGQGDEVVTTPYTFFATAGAIARLGARPVFADIEHDSFNLDPDRLEEAITERTRAIVVVHLFGRPADMDRVGAVAARHDLPVIEDAAQAIGAEWGGRRVGGLGTLGCFSFFPAKNLGALGDGGLVTTNDADLAERVGRLRRHGAEGRYMHREVGGNFRLDAIQAAVLRVKLPELEDWTATRQDNALGYRERFRARGLDDVVVQPEEGPGRHVWNQYVVRVLDGRRADVFDGLREAEIGCAVYYPLPLHQQPCLRDPEQPAGSLPEAERASREALALPVAPGLTPEDQDEVVETIAKLLDR